MKISKWSFVGFIFTFCMWTALDILVLKYIPDGKPLIVNNIKDFFTVSVQVHLVSKIIGSFFFAVIVSFITMKPKVLK